MVKTLRMTPSQVRAHQKKMGKPTANISAQSIHESEFERQLYAHGLTDWVAEHRFDLSRRWRFDFAFPDFKIAVEVEGIVYNGRGRHQTPDGYAKDCEKYNSALIQGWRVLRFVPTMISNGTAIDVLKLALIKWDSE